MSVLTEAEAVEEVQGLSQSAIDQLRHEARTNLYFLAVGLLGYKDVNLETHGRFCKFVQGSPKLRRLGLMPRGHLKSTIATIADSVRIALLEPDHARILIASETVTLAEKFLREIKGHFESNAMLRSLFPELIPRRFAGPGVTWSAAQASLVRSVSHKEPTWQAVGVGGQIVGSHFTRIKCDDLIGFDALRSTAAMETAKAWAGYIEPLLVNQNTDIIDFIGTRWSKNDLYGKLMKAYGSEMAVFTRGAIEIGLDDKPYIIFPAKYNWDRYRFIQEDNPALWYAQYENDPKGTGLSDLAWENTRRYAFSTDGEWVVLGEGKKWHWTQLDKVLTADPNSGSVSAPDAAAISVQGLSPDDELIQLDSQSGRWDPTEFVDRIYASARRWQVKAVGIEKAGQQNTRHYFERKIAEHQYYVRVVDLEPKGRKKEDRIRYALGPIIRSGKYYTLPSQSALNQQGTDFPDTILWDELDAAAYGPDLLVKPDCQDPQSEKDRQSLIKKLLARRSSRTGY